MRDKERHQSREISLSASSAASPGARSAFSFFYIRQMAFQKSEGTALLDAGELTIGIDCDQPPNAPEMEAVLQRLAHSELNGVKVYEGSEAELVLECRREPDVARSLIVNVVLPGRSAPTAQLKMPRYLTQNSLFELALRPNAPTSEDEHARLAQLSQVFRRLGFQAIVTNPGGGSVVSQVLGAYLEPILRFILAGALVEDVNATLRAHGFTRRPCSLLRLDDLGRDWLEQEVLSAIPAMEEPYHVLLWSLAEESIRGRPSAALFEAICLSLLARVDELLASGQLSHVSFADLMARELFDFPLQWTSLCRYLRCERVRAFLAGSELEGLLRGEVLQRCEEIVARGREFYL